MRWGKWGRERKAQEGIRDIIHRVESQRSDICHLAAAKVGPNEPTRPPLVRLLQQWKERILVVGVMRRCLCVRRGERCLLA